MSDLHTRYMGLTLRSPLVASAGPIQQKVDGVKALADAGAEPSSCTPCSRSR